MSDVNPSAGKKRYQIIQKILVKVEPKTKRMDMFRRWQQALNLGVLPMKVGLARLSCALFTLHCAKEISIALKSFEFLNHKFCCGQIFHVME